MGGFIDFWVLMGSQIGTSFANKDQSSLDQEACPGGVSMAALWGGDTLLKFR